MSDKIRVVRLDGLAVALWGEPIPGDVTKLADLIERVGAVIELTEEPGPPLEMRDYDEGPTRRWVSELEAADE